MNATRCICIALLLGSLACSPDEPGSARRSESTSAAEAQLPAILLVTLDTTRADAMGFESGSDATPNLDALAARGQRFAHAYTTAPMTLPAHTSLLTGLYPGAHGIHENARTVDPGLELLGERLEQRGYATAAFISGLPLGRQFGLARGFGHYDDTFEGGASERDAAQTTARAIAHLQSLGPRPAFLWVHYFDPHEPYAPPEPFRSRYPADPYLGEIAFMDEQVGRLVEAFDERFSDRPVRILVVGDHGEGRGEHGETLHGSLLYQGVMRVPLLVLDGSLAPAVIESPVSTRQVFHTVLGWAGTEHPGDGQPADLLHRDALPVLAEAMKPYLQYGWQPQVMAVLETTKVIRSGDTEIYDVAIDPGETLNLTGDRQLAPALRQALADYPLPNVSASTADDPGLSRDDRERLARLGYVGGGDRQPARRREDAPNPRDMAFLFADLDHGSALFIQRRYDEAIPLFEKILTQDPQNLMVTLRLAVAYSVEDQEPRALDYFARARQIDPESIDLEHYLAMHYFRFQHWDQAAPLFETVLATMPDRLPALECMALIREKEGRLDEAARYLERIARLRGDPATTLLRLGQTRMAMGDTEDAIIALERAREIQGDAFPASLQLGVLYFAAQRLPEAAAALDQVPPDDPGYAMALFKRAQVSVLLAEPDRAERLHRAQQSANARTRQLIEREPLFR